MSQSRLALLTNSFNHAILDERIALDSLLSRATGASFKSEDRPLCLSGTRTEVLDALYGWADDVDAKEMLCWLKGHAGSGKSTIAQTVAKRLDERGRLGASFFCSRESQERSDLKLIFPTLAYQLAYSTNVWSHKFRSSLLHALQANPDTAKESPATQLEELITKPAIASGIRAVVLVDALDECRDEGNISTVISLLGAAADRMPNLKFLITSRPEIPIRSAFRLKEVALVTKGSSLQDVPITVVNEDIRRFLEERLTGLAARRSDVDLSRTWPSRNDIDTLVDRSAGLFIYAATVVKFIENDNYPPPESLQLLVCNDTIDGRARRHNPYADIDRLYAHILGSALEGQDVTRARAILGLLAIAYEPLSCCAIAEILAVSTSEVNALLRSLHSVLIVPTHTTSPIRFHHKSFPDFLMDPARCTDSVFQISLDEHHHQTAIYCLKMMNLKLKKNMCGLPRYAFNKDLDPKVLDRCISEATRYCVQFWASHLLADNNRDEHLPNTIPHLEQFLANQQLFWFEVLGLLRRLKYAAQALDKLGLWLQPVCVR